jgi:Trk K+ transport system NAD-binding subunit
MVVNPGSAAAGKTLEEGGLLAPDAARVLAVRRSDGALDVNPNGNLRLDEGDLVIALGTEDQLFASASRLR